VIVAMTAAPLRGVPILPEFPDDGPGSSHGGDERRHTILVVDDDRTNLKLARFVLEAEGFDVREAVDAMSTFEVLKTCNPSLIVMDIQLPGMDGWELTRRLKTNFATRHIPVIAVTAYGVAGDRQLAKTVGAIDFVEKPISTTELPEIIRRHLSDGDPGERD
jgi:two-component system cell cycle response regulator DivK